MKKEKIMPYLLLLPSILVVIILFGYPILLTIYQSFNEVNILNGTMKFIGFDNFKYILTDKAFFRSLIITFKYTMVTVVLKLLLGFIFAYLLYCKIYLKKFFRFLVLIPWAIPQVAISTIWIWILDGKYGYINYFLKKIRLINKPLVFLSDPNLAFYSVSFVDAWLGISLVSMMFLASLEQIPTNLYEASEIDGAGKFRQFLDITLPEIKKTFITVLILVSIWTFNSFNVIYVLTQGGPMRATETLVIKIYEEAFSRFNIGVSSALSVIVVIILIVLTTIYLKRLKYEK